MARVAFVVVLLCAAAFVAQAKDDRERKELHSDDVRRRPLPPTLRSTPDWTVGRGLTVRVGADPCAHCAKCLAKDAPKRTGIAKCIECEDGFVKENGFCEPFSLPPEQQRSNYVGVRKPCVCTKEYAPVCGRNHVTYSNPCEARCDKEPVQCEGECPCRPPPFPKPLLPACTCPANYAPVCGSNRKTFANACLARCEGVEPKCNGECPCKPEPPICQLCARDPCENKYCPRQPDATCRVKKCSCDAEFVLDNRVVDCTPVRPVCPPNQPLVQCFADPCSVAECPAFPHATCEANFCGGCNAEFFVHGEKVNCDECVRERQSCTSDADCCGNDQCCKDCMPMKTSAHYGPPRKGVCMDRCPKDCHRWL